MKTTFRSEMTVKRPNGEIEVVDTTEKLKIITDSVFNQIKAATAKAGKGEVLSYQNIFGKEEVEPISAEELAAEKAFYEATESETVTNMSRMGE